MKHIGEVLAVIAKIDGETVEEVKKRYCWRRADSRILFSPTELPFDAAGDMLDQLVNSVIDGIQIDAGDGSIG